MFHPGLPICLDENGEVLAKMMEKIRAVSTKLNTIRGVKGLGFGKLNGTREVIDTPSLRGMVAMVPHLVRIVE